MDTITTCDRDTDGTKRNQAQHIRQGWERLARRLRFRTAQNVECQMPSIGLVLIVQANGWNGDALLPLLRSAGYTARVVDERGTVPAIKADHPLLLIVGGSANLDLYCDCRCATTAPILALVPDADPERALSAFAAGVDDYQSGPISPREIVARVGALLRSLRRRSSSKFSL